MVSVLYYGPHSAVLIIYKGEEQDTMLALFSLGQSLNEVRENTRVRSAPHRRGSLLQE